MCTLLFLLVSEVRMNFNQQKVTDFEVLAEIRTTHCMHKLSEMRQNCSKGFTSYLINS